ncbi:MAG TPA: hypothetical protein VHV31_10845 [Nitrolancea sp.]|nr:hypothetical protein [Nitrolancea sp.]
MTVGAMRSTLADVAEFSRVFMPGLALRRYQAEPAQAIASAVLARRRNIGTASEFAVIFSRQSGKDEMLAQLCAYLLVLFQRSGGQIVVALPTMRPQGMIARDRLAARLAGTRLRTLGLARVRDGSIVELGRASVHFLSASPSSNARGNTASLLLVANECQDIEPDTWDSVFAPMAAASNAVTLYMGTVWTARTLLARQQRYVGALQALDGRQRSFLTPWTRVAEELPPYGEYVERERERLGADHPFIKTEYELIELDGDGGLFPPSRRGQMIGDHSPLTVGVPGETYALLLDVAGEEEDHGPDGAPGVVQYDATAKRDSTALTVVRVVTPSPPAEPSLTLPSLEGENQLPILGEGSDLRPRYEVVRRYLWTGTRHTALYQQLLDLARNVWKARYVVVDATGVGAGLTSFLRAALGERVVVPFVFSQASKSALGWGFLGVIDSGRFKDYATLTPHPSPTPRGRGETKTETRTGIDAEARSLAGIFWRQVEQCTYDVRPGPNRLMSWGVPDLKVHDDLLLSAALVARLDEIDWRPRGAVGR